MKQLIFLLMICASVYAQEFNYSPFRNDGRFIKDSTKWVIRDTLNVGDVNCEHIWIEGDFGTAGNGMGCLVFHNGAHCSYDNKTKNRICAKCYRKEKLEELYFEHFEPYSETEYDKLNEHIKPPIHQEPSGSLSFSNIGTLLQTDSFNEATSTAYFSPRWLEEFVSYWDSYQKECLDTIRATAFEGEYLIDRGNYRELMTAKQLEDKGYRYKYRWIKNTKPSFEFEYVWIYKADIEGFMTYLKRKLGDK